MVFSYTALETEAGALDVAKLVDRHVLELNPPDDLQITVSPKYVIKRSVMYDA
ncbi:MAG: hypothetical protein P8J24_08120 [Arenicellales bacterium]|nr:hypothetical protein [Arenicellales bacterium]